MCSCLLNTLKYSVGYRLTRKWFRGKDTTGSEVVSDKYDQQVFDSDDDFEILPPASTSTSEQDINHNVTKKRQCPDNFRPEGAVYTSSDSNATYFLQRVQGDATAGTSAQCAIVEDISVERQRGRFYGKRPINLLNTSQDQFTIADSDDETADDVVNDDLESSDISDSECDWSAGHSEVSSSAFSDEETEEQENVIFVRNPEEYPSGTVSSP